MKKGKQVSPTFSGSTQICCMTTSSDTEIRKPACTGFSRENGTGRCVWWTGSAGTLGSPCHHRWFCIGLFTLFLIGMVVFFHHDEKMLSSIAGLPFCPAQPAQTLSTSRNWCPHPFQLARAHLRRMSYNYVRTIPCTHCQRLPCSWVSWPCLCLLFPACSSSDLLGFSLSSLAALRSSELSFKGKPVANFRLSPDVLGAFRLLHGGDKAPPFAKCLLQVSRFFPVVFWKQLLKHGMDKVKWVFF